MEPIILTINEACQASRTGRTALYAAIKSGHLPARKRGSRTMIPSRFPKLSRQLSVEKSSDGSCTFRQSGC